MFNLVSLKGFKSFRDLDLPLKNLTLFSGLNNSGKSSIIQSIRMYARASEGKSPYIDGFGTIKELRSKFVNPESLIEISLQHDRNGIDTLALHEKDELQIYPTLSPIISYLSADRLGPQTFLPLSNDENSIPKLGDRGEYVYEFIDKLAWSIVPQSILHECSEGETLPLALKGWLSEISPNLEFHYIFNKKADIAQAEFNSYRSKNVGFGISHALPVIASLLGHVAQRPLHDWDFDWGKEWDQRRENSTLVLIENPETHIHPKGQTAMGVLIALAASHGAQIIVETHSDHLMDGIRLACKNKLISHDKVIFHYLSKESIDSETNIQTPKMDENGKLDFWPNGFFDQSLKVRAKLARK
ncbi:DUF3696 domain-containing protein [Thalassotalea sp. 1_MG-2023]|uniref:AAA family ATPase n=1 Tax=Thalassotalea sp. 1_MG-2023 TaxID=3062680 RepID=UPI0026E383CE|nr:DUF3696 domain-containing protein [Thalassotalea sp. 1_MG-2023]MDO6427241.1 DUF3696 domain-containing protein [Thalassotalea sp. 1_MG-2023]